LLDGRPEGVLVLLQTLTIWALLRYLDSSRGVFLILAAAFTAIGVETHPNGVLPALYVAIALFMTRSTLGWRTAGWVLLAAAVGTGIMALGLLWNKGLGPFLAAFGEIAGDGGHGHPPYKEYTRYLSYFRRFPVHFVVIALGLAGLFGIGIGAPKTGNARALRLLQACAVATLLFLLLLPTKWEHYVASLYPFALVGLCLQALALQRGLQRGMMFGAGIALAFALMQSFLDNDAAHRLLKLPTERGRLLATLQDKVRDQTVLGPVKLHFFMSTAADFQVTEGAPFQSQRHIPDLKWVILDPLVDLRRRQEELGYCLDYDMSVVINRSHYNVFRTAPCREATPPSH
jgi:hypothetical protein